MHMSDALLSPAVGGTAWAATAGLIGYSSRKLRDRMDDHRVPLMAVLGAFIFAAQMVNFTIPATGSSGHLGGGLMLAVILGPYAGFLTLASVLIIQALFFADGGLLALGCNIFNLGFFPCFVVYPLIYRRIAGRHRKTGWTVAAAMIGAAAALQLGSLAVVAQTFLSGISELPFRTFLLVMQPIHLAIGIAEGLATAAVILFVMKARPEILTGSLPGQAQVKPIPLKTLAAGFIAASLLTGTGLSLLSSSLPDGLEWSILRVTGRGEVRTAESPAHRTMENVQDRTAILPDYSLAGDDLRPDGRPEGSAPPWWGTSLSGLVGGTLTLLLAGAMWLVVRKRRVSK